VGDDGFCGTSERAGLIDKTLQRAVQQKIITEEQKRHVILPVYYRNRAELLAPFRQYHTSLDQTSQSREPTFQSREQPTSEPRLSGSKSRDLTVESLDATIQSCEPGDGIASLEVVSLDILRTNGQGRWAASGPNPVESLVVTTCPELKAVTEAVLRKGFEAAGIALERVEGLCHSVYGLFPELVRENASPTLLDGPIAYLVVRKRLGP